jgi:uncharacterized membrane protein (DUF485 family)
MSYDTSPSYPRPPAQQYPYDPAQQYPYDPAQPWQYQEPQPTGQRLPRREALGHHSDLRILRGAYRWQRRVATLTALGYFTLFLVLSAYAPSFMTSDITPGLPAGLLLALVQLPVTCLAIVLYEHTARRFVDPIADRIRKQAELDAKREAAR